MYQQERLLTAYCGLYCADCIRYESRASDLAKELMDILEQKKFGEYSEVKRASVRALDHFGKLKSTLKAIEELKCDKPCRTDDNECTKVCEIIKCAKAKNLEGCWECDELDPCEKFEFLRPFHGDAPKTNCRLVRKYGLDHWSAHRSKCYTWL